MTSSRTIIFVLGLLLAPLAWSHEGDDHGGTPTIVEGEAEVEIADDYVRGRSETKYFVKDSNGKRRELDFPAGMKKPTFVTGDKISVKGHVHGNRPNAVLLDEPVAALGGTSSTSTGSVAAAVSGTRTALAIITEFTDATVGCADTAVSNTLFAPAPAMSVDTYFKETSRGLLGFTGNVVRVKLDRAMGTTCDYNTWASAAATEAAKQTSLSGFTHKIYVLPSNAPCGWGGLGTIGGGSTWVKQCNSGYIYAHELGHNLTLWHAATVGNEYGDASDVMGNSFRPVNAPHSAKMGWTPSTNVQSVTQSGTYRITSLETDPAAAISPQVIKILKEDTGEMYYLSMRTASGQFGAGLSSLYTNKLNVHRWSGSGNTTFIGSYALDQTFSDTVNGVDAKTIAVNGNTIDVQVTITAVCRRSAPTVSASTPAAITPGQSTSATIYVRNNDSAYCPASTFATSGSVTGLSSSVSAPSVTVGPGSTGSFMVNVSSSTLTVPNTYSGTASANDASVSGHSGSTGFTVTVKTTTTRGKGRKNR